MFSTGAAAGGPVHAVAGGGPASSGNVPLAPPPVRKLARDLGVDLYAVPGSGPEGEAPRFARSGFGIMGLRERVQLLGGTVTSGLLENGRWILRASIPLHPDAPVRPDHES